MAANNGLMKTFRFKHFSVLSGGDAMGVGTDGVLLGAWTEIPQSTRRILDAGTGSGLIALMLAQRCKEALITGVDINAGAVEIAKQNAAQSSWEARLTFACCDIRTFDVPEKFDLIVSNPPFFPAGSLEKGSARSKQRSFETLTLHQLVVTANGLLAPGGSLAVVVPSDMADDLEYDAWELDLLPVHITDVVTKEGKQAKRKLMQFVKTDRVPYSAVRDVLVLQTADGKRTPQYEELTKDFYLDKI